MGDGGDKLTISPDKSGFQLRFNNWQGKISLSALICDHLWLKFVLDKLTLR